MISFPGTLRVHKKIPKEAFYKRLPLTAAAKKHFVSDIDEIYMEWVLSKDGLHLDKKGTIGEIDVLLITLKAKNYSFAVPEAIARGIPHKLLFIMKYDDEVQLAIHYGHLYAGPWQKEEEIDLKAEGLSIDEIWQNFMKRIVLTDVPENRQEDPVKEQVALQNKISELKKTINKLETAVWKEEQPKKKFEIYTKLEAKKKELEALIHG